MSDRTINKITAYKIKIDDYDNLSVDGYDEVKTGNISLTKGNYTYKLFFKKQFAPKHVDWYGYFQDIDLGLEEKKIPKKLSSGFIWLINMEKSSYSITGGVGHHALRKHTGITIEPRFGVNIAQKILSIPELSGLVQKDTSGIVNYLHRMFRGRYNPSGDINNLKRVLTLVKGKLLKKNDYYEKIGKSIQASDSLAVNGEKNIKSTIEFLEKVEELWNKEEKTIEIPQLQDINKKHYSVLLDSLNTTLVEKIKTGDLEDNSLFLDNEEIGYLPDRVTKYKIVFKRNKTECDTYRDVFTHVKSILEKEDDANHAFFSINVEMHFDDGYSDTESLFYLICGDVVFNNEVYFINNKLWYQANEQFVQKLNREINNIEYIEPENLGLLPWDVEKHKDANNRSSEYKYNLANNEFVCLDHKTVKIEEERSRIEFCDLFKHADKGQVTLVHVKKDCGAALRALFAQGFVSAKLYDENDEFKECIYSANLKKEKPDLTDTEKQQLAELSNLMKRNIKIIFAIFDNKPTHRILDTAKTTSEKLNGTLTLFAKVDFLERVNSIRSMGYSNVAVTRIKEYQG